MAYEKFQVKRLEKCKLLNRRVEGTGSNVWIGIDHKEVLLKKNSNLRRCHINDNLPNDVLGKKYELGILLELTSAKTELAITEDDSFASE